MLRHRLYAALALVTLLLLGRGAVAVRYAHAGLNPGLNDAARAAVSEISGLIVETSLYSDPMDDVRRALLVVLGPTGRVVCASASAIEQASPQAHHPRAPPAV